MTRFNPFQKDIADLRVDDLVRLRGVPEGWFVEYKSEVPNAAAIAKSVAALANHQGGWLVYGVRTTTDGDNVPEAWPGLGGEDVPGIQERIRDAVAQHLSPTPRFQLRFLRGPCEGVGLAAGRVVAVVYVPVGQDPPYIHSSGRIYRRVADRSDPRPETDRHVVDQLWARGKAGRDRFREQFGRPPELSEGEANIPFVTLHLLRDPLREQELTSELTYARFTDLMRSRDAESGGIGFDSFMSVPEGLLARQVAGKNPAQAAFTWLHCPDGTSVVSSPLRYGSIDFAASAKGLAVYRHADDFLEKLVSAGLESGSWVDLNILLAIAAAVVKRQLTLLREGALPRELRFLARVQGVWHRVPFVDMPSYVVSLTDGGIPLIQSSELSVPSRWDLSTAIDFEIDEGDPDHATKTAFGLWLRLFRAFGLERLLEPLGGDRAMELAEAHDRGLAAYAGHGTQNGDAR